MSARLLREQRLLNSQSASRRKRFPSTKIYPSIQRPKRKPKSRAKTGRAVWRLSIATRAVKETSDGKSPFLPELPKAGQSRRTFGRGDFCAGVFRRPFGCAKGVSFRLFFCDDFFGAFFLHLILILIDPDFNEQQQKTTEEKTL